MTENSAYKGVDQFNVILQYYFGLTEINHLDFSRACQCLWRSDDRALWYIPI